MKLFNYKALVLKVMDLVTYCLVQLTGNIIITVGMILARFCPDCKNDTSDVVTAGEKLKLSKKKSKMMSNINKECTRDWGKVQAISSLVLMVLICVL